MKHSEAKSTSAARQMVRIAEGEDVVAAVLTHGDIARRAFEIYVQSGHRQDPCKENWLLAEQELRKQAKEA